MKVIGFCGLPGSGKSTAIEAIIDLGIIITMGDVIRNEAKKRNVDLIDENLGMIAKELRERGGPKIIADKCVELINGLDSEVIFIDGLRSISEVDEFKKFWKFPIVAIDTEDKIRFKLLYERGRDDDPKNKQEFKERDERERGFGIRKVINIADYKIKNNLDIKELQKKTREIILDIIKKY